MINANRIQDSKYVPGLDKDVWMVKGNINIKAENIATAIANIITLLYVILVLKNNLFNIFHLLKWATVCMITIRTLAFISTHNY